MAGAIRIVKGKYEMKKGSIRMHGDDVTMFGDGYTKIVYLHQSYVLTNENQNSYSEKGK